MIRQNFHFTYIVLAIVTACLMLTGSDASAQPPRDRDGRGERRERGDFDERSRPPRDGRPGPMRGPGDERGRNRGDRGDRGRRMPDPLPEDEVLAFIGENHPELLKSINWLKKQRRTQYDSALRGISGQLRRLKGIKEHSSDRYALELQLWKVDSRIRLLAGQQTLNPTDEQKAELLRLIADDMTLRPKVEMARISEQLESLKERREKMEKRIDKGPDESKVSQRLEEILERTRGRMESVKGAGKGRHGRPKQDSDSGEAPTPTE